MSLLQKYNVPGPRYTSYPTVPFWEHDPTTKEWFDQVKLSFDTSKEDGISVYIHLPFCEHLCTYCGCNKSITQNHDRERPYIDAVLKEWQMYMDVFGEKPKVQEVHLGGGTPTFFSAENLEHLIESLKEKAIFSKTIELSIEVHPSYTSREQLETLYKIGFKRISIGVQDFDIKVQTAISRIQPFKEVELTSSQAREIGFESVNFDLIYGLPFQTKESILDTFEQVQKLTPDRIAYYSYAHVPWTSKAQRLFSDEDLPVGEEKRALYELGRKILEETGYFEIGMDHFALKNDSLYKSYESNTLHRNFMGYTTNNTKLMVGLGASSISDSWGAFIQNEKHWKKYMDAINAGNLPIIRGHLLTEEDLVIRQLILDIMCHFHHDFNEKSKKVVSDHSEYLEELIQDELLIITDDKIEVRKKGKTFVRNICMTFDKRLLAAKPEQQIFSSTV